MLAELTSQHAAALEKLQQSKKGFEDGKRKAGLHVWTGAIRSMLTPKKLKRSSKTTDTECSESEDTRTASCKSARSHTLPELPSPRSPLSPLSRPRIFARF